MRNPVLAPSHWDVGYGSRIVSMKLCNSYLYGQLGTSFTTFLHKPKCNVYKCLL